jgi:hypothetical protein
MVAGRLALTAVVVKPTQIVHKLNWLVLFEKYIKIMKIVNYKDSWMGPIEHFFPRWAKGVNRIWPSSLFSHATADVFRSITVNFS